MPEEPKNGIIASDMDKQIKKERKNKVVANWFSAYDTTRIIGKTDFCVAIPATELGLFEPENALWAEAREAVA